MVAEAWDHRSKAATAAVLMSGLPADESPGTDALHATVSAHLDAGLISAIKKIGRAENRSVSSTIGTLIREAIQTRNAAPANAA